MSNSEYLRPLPGPDPVSQPFWDGCARHELLLQRCAGCGKHRFPPGPVCTDCGGAEVDWVPVSGRGTVYSWIVVHHPVPRESFEGEVPYVVALIALAEGVRMASNVVGCPPDAVRAGMAVQVVFDDVADGVSLPKFRPLETD